MILELDRSELTTCIHIIDKLHDICACLYILETAEVCATDATRSRESHLYRNLNRSALNEMSGYSFIQPHERMDSGKFRPNKNTKVHF